jgi:hypothetical protein
LFKFIHFFGEYTAIPNLISGKFHYSAIFCKRLQDCLADPPYSIGNKSESFRSIKSFRSFYKTSIPFADEIL